MARARQPGAHRRADLAGSVQATRPCRLGAHVSAIARVYRLGGLHVDPAVVWEMADAMPHRSPDGSATWYAGTVGLGVFHATAESLHEVLPLTEALPLTNVAGTISVTADARIDNRDELVSMVELDAGAGEVADSDELVPLAYEAWGGGCSTCLVGDFAFALWDDRAPKLLCARDQFGVRPLPRVQRRRPGDDVTRGGPITARGARARRRTGRASRLEVLHRRPRGGARRRAAEAAGGAARVARRRRRGSGGTSIRSGGTLSWLSRGRYDTRYLRPHEMVAHTRW